MADTEEAVQSEKGKKGEGKGQDQACFPNHNSNEKHKRGHKGQIACPW